MSNIYINEHRHNTLGKMSTEILLKDIGAQLAHLADEVREQNELAKQNIDLNRDNFNLLDIQTKILLNNVKNQKSKVCYEDGSESDISDAYAYLYTDGEPFFGCPKDEDDEPFEEDES